MNVDISTYNDADLLAGAIASVRDHLPDAHVTVTDGRYATFEPDAPPNSTDDTRAVCERHGVDYDAPDAAPFDREVDKHRYRVGKHPDGERVLFLDADERIVTADVDALDDDTAYAVRFHNPAVYNSTPIRYWPRYFSPEQVLEVSRWDRYLFDAACERTDHVTIAHRHDLRDRAYREAKYDRFDREGRQGRYADAFEQYLADEWGVETGPCPACGHESLSVSPATNGGGGFTRVRTCIDGECYADTEAVDVGAWRYVPDDFEAGLRDDPERLRLELMDAGCEWVAMTDFTSVRTGEAVADVAPAVRWWLRERFEGPSTPEAT